jgi:ribonuclease BN (tRNA processing enzyme)
MQLTVLGKSPSWQDGGGACSGYLIRADGYRLLLDCGSGVFGKLRLVEDYLDLDAVLISHLHPDHFLDLVPFSFALGYSPRGNSRRPELHAPPGAGELFRCLSGCWGSADQVERAFELIEYAPRESLQLGPISVRFCEVPHYTRAYACELSVDGRRLTFGADCGPNPALEQFAAGTDLLMVEATLQEPDEDEPPGHMTPAQAGTMGRRAGARRLVLTHFSDEVDAEWIRAEAERTFGGQVALAAEGLALDV